MSSTPSPSAKQPSSPSTPSPHAGVGGGHGSDNNNAAQKSENNNNNGGETKNKPTTRYSNNSSSNRRSSRTSSNNRDDHNKQGEEDDDSDAAETISKYRGPPTVHRRSSQELLIDLRQLLLRAFFQKAGISGDYAVGWEVEQKTDTVVDGINMIDSTNLSADDGKIYLHENIEQSFNSLDEVVNYLIKEEANPSAAATATATTTATAAAASNVIVEDDSVSSPRVSSNKKDTESKANRASSNKDNNNRAPFAQPRPYTVQEDKILLQQRAKGHTFTTIANSFLRNRSAASLIGRYHSLSKLRAESEGTGIGKRSSNSSSRTGGGGGEKRSYQRSSNNRDSSHRATSSSSSSRIRRDPDMEFYRRDDEILKSDMEQDGSDSTDNSKLWLNDEIYVQKRQKLYYVRDDDEYAKRLRSSATKRKKGVPGSAPPPKPMSS
jgi:hypothetical protein